MVAIILALVSVGIVSGADGDVFAPENRARLVVACLVGAGAAIAALWRGI